MTSVPPVQTYTQAFFPFFFLSSAPNCSSDLSCQAFLQSSPGPTVQIAPTSRQVVLQMIDAPAIQIDPSTHPGSPQMIITSIQASFQSLVQAVQLTPHTFSYSIQASFQPLILSAQTVPQLIVPSISHPYSITPGSFIRPSITHPIPCTLYFSLRRSSLPFRSAASCNSTRES